MSKKPSIPKGTRDFSPTEVARRNYIISKIKNQFKLFGFQPIETPSFENSETLLGKYGEEGDRLIFKILDSGDYFGKTVERGKYLGETQFAYLNLHLYDSLKIIFKEIVEKNNITEYENMVKSQFVEGYSGFHNYINDKKLLHLVKDFLIKKSAFFKEYLNDIIKAVKNGQSFNHQFNAFYRKNFLDSKHHYEDFIEDLVKNGYNLFDNLESKKLSTKISDKALRYDLTVPFARYVVMHQNEITFPFKRYQIQPVWRADRPRKGRFREFFQCDADVVGTKSLFQEVAFVQLYDAVFSDIKLDGVIIKINHRKILSGIAETLGIQDKLIDFTVALDKLDKIEEEGVKIEMLSKGIPEDAIQKINPLFQLKGTNQQKLEELKIFLKNSKIGIEGINDLLFILNTVDQLQIKSSKIEIDITLARGLNYYTGTIFEVLPPENIEIGSIGGGGRYDDLTGIFGLKDMSGVGISFGLDRIYLVLEKLNLFPANLDETAQVLFVNFGNEEALQALKLIKQLRQIGIKTEFYPDAAKLKKQFTYADKQNIPFVVLIGEEEVKNKTVVVKNMKSGKQETHSMKEILTFFTEK